MRSLHLSLLAAVLFVHSAPAQSASYAYFGTGCSPTVPMTVTGVPTLGGSFSLETYGTYSSGFFGWSNSTLLLGFSNQTWAGGALPFAFPTPSPCGSLLVSPDILVGAPAGNGLVSVAFAVPNDASLLGVTFYQQVARLFVSCGKMGCGSPNVWFSVGGEGVIGT
ncbi:MAG: hypothetical protein L0323_14085 [Planctomycetes bacterium]|nr:hypothetical protein [Planctomycetota bacterium]